ncbi:MAG: hypothetical protein H6707_00585 [Deltaproteobacteria bacterium]|nr:hypothetical protein [Deltaproteobacteria bacterium]
MSVHRIRLHSALATLLLLSSTAWTAPKTMDKNNRARVRAALRAIFPEAKRFRLKSFETRHFATTINGKYFIAAIDAENPAKIELISRDRNITSYSRCGERLTIDTTRRDGVKATALVHRTAGRTLTLRQRGDRHVLVELKLPGQKRQIGGGLARINARLAASNAGLEKHLGESMLLVDSGHFSLEPANQQGYIGARYRAEHQRTEKALLDLTGRSLGSVFSDTVTTPSVLAIDQLGEDRVYRAIE